MPSDYLKRERGEEIAHLILTYAQVVAKPVSESPRAAPLTAPERRQALGRVKALLPLIQRDIPDLGYLFDLLVQRYSKEGVVRRGRRRGSRATFASLMLDFGAGELVARNQVQLTVTELIATAAAVGFDGMVWANLKEEFDGWRKLHESNLPKDPAALAEAARKKMAEEQEAHKRRWIEARRRGLDMVKADVALAKRKWLLARLRERGVGSGSQSGPADAELGEFFSPELAGR